jgi:tetratricopeptide (TPR) repeat protein
MSYWDEKPFFYGPQEDRMKHFFVSYNSADRTWAEWIAWQLEEAGYTTVLQAWDFRPGSNFVLEMQRAATEAERTIAVLSQAYLEALYTQPEWAAAFGRDPTGEKGILLPVRVGECKLEGLLPQIIHIDLVDLDESAAKDALLAGVRFERARPTVAPGFPGAVPRSVPERPRFPGALPPIWNLPHLRNPNFTGRESLLAALRSALTSGQPAALTQAIHGLGGVGKTQLAVEYAYRHAAEYEVVWWVRAEEAATLAADYAALAGPLNLPQKDEPDQGRVVQAVRHELGQGGGWLLVFDNAQDPQDLHGYLPQAGTGHVLVTSRNPAWREVARPLTVQVWERAESVAFLLKWTDQALRRGSGQADEAAAAALADALGDLPLALAQAGAYVETHGATLAEYREMFQARRTELWEDERPPLDYPDTVATTWSLAMERICEASPVSADLLNLCAYLGPDDIRQTLLREGKEHIPEPLSATVADRRAMNKAMAPLLQYSLLERSGQALSVHRMVQAVARDRLAESERRTWAEAALRLVNDAFPFDITTDMQTWPVCARLLPHALAAARQAEALGVAAEATGRLLNQAGAYLWGRAEFAEAKATYERVLAITEAAYGLNHPNVAACLNNLGLVLQDLGDLDGARAHYERALAIDEAAFGPHHPKVARDVNNLGGVMYALGDLDGARAHYQRALQIFQEFLGEDHANTVTVRGNLESLDG